jgi:glyceraldehyde 3-phosphate dehydrogenase
MTTVHAYTNDQNLMDNRHSDLQRARAAGLSMIPSSTGAAKAIGLVLPELAGKLDGTAIRVPTPNVSLVDFTFVSSKPTSSSEINTLIEKAAAKGMKGILSVVNEPLVSIDFNHSSYSSNFDTLATKVVDGTFCRVAAWYDNEWGFSVRMLDVAEYWSGL